MAKVGDLVEVTIYGGGGRSNWGVGLVNSTTDIGGSVSIASGQTMTIPGKIIEDRGDNWLIELGIHISGKNLILVPKTAQR